MFCKLLVVNLIIFSMCTQCSILDNLIYNQNIYQGNYFTEKDINKIKNGMTQEQIVYILGYPMLTDPFGTETWFYIFRQNLSINLIKQKSLILYFNKKGILINFKKIE
ncbi:Outer membrane protein assembly factor BamE [Candidatus Providencia siddallii]|uniref:Outer membrane protein assembly factor BamE n=1 Tax=Candidatus Providencia siddallii TaxID=1715285 RepID=A0ABM9NPN9_9GAMM